MTSAASRSDCSNASPGYKFTGLTPWSTYVLSVRAYYLADGAKVYSPVASLTTSTRTIDGFVVPSAPRSLTTLVSPASGVGSGEVHLRWEAPNSDGGTPITDYLIERSADGTSEWLPIVDEVDPTRNATVTGLSNGTRVYFRVLAVSEVGTGLASTVVNATPRTVPDAPESLTATPGDGVIQLEWLAPASTGGSSITDYVVERSTDGTSGWVKIEELISSVRSFTVTGLVNGTRAYFRVLAVNEAGRSAASDVVETASRSVASPPQLLTATPSNASGQVRLSWSVPASDGPQRSRTTRSSTRPTGRRAG